MQFDRDAATGLLYAQSSTATGGSRSDFQGTCFLLRSDHFAITAAHCVPEGRELTCHFPHLKEEPLPVLDVIRHPRADIAALGLDGCFEVAPSVARVRLPDVDPTYGFWDSAAHYVQDADIWAFGYPSEGSPSGQMGPHPQTFKGHIQATFDYEDAVYRYRAAQLSFPAPGGLSGAPVGYTDILDRPVGLITKSSESYRVIDSVEEKDESGKVLRIESRKVITYGIAMILGDVSQWLSDVLPAPGFR